MPVRNFQIQEKLSAAFLQNRSKINVSTISGKLRIGVKNRDTSTYVLELTECTKDKYNQVVSIEKTGQYSIVLEMSNHTGSYEVIGTPITS